MTNKRASGGQIPIPESYCAAENLYAGEYPGSLRENEAKAKIQSFVSFGVTDFIDLTEVDLLIPYAPFLLEGMTRHSYPLPDHGVPDSFEWMDRLLDRIDELLEGGRKVYVHGRGGGGRTGLAIACWLGRKNRFTGKEALLLLNDLWLACSKSRRLPNSPENEEQRAYVVDYLARPGSVTGKTSKNAASEAEEIDSSNGFNPSFDELRTYVLSLQSELTQLLFERDELELHTCRQIEALYLSKIGILECKVYEFTNELLRLRRKLEIIRAKKIREEDIHLDEIEARLDEEYQEFIERLSALRESVDWAARRIGAETLSAEETREFKSRYYKIVKKLHPDLNPNITASAGKLLEQAISAFARTDVTTLKMIEAAIMEIASEETAPRAYDGLLRERGRLSAARNRLLREIEQIKASFPYNQLHFLNDEAKVAKKEAELHSTLELLKEQYALEEMKLKELLDEK